MARWYFLKAFNSQIARRITLWVFGSLMAIEAAILLPSYAKRERDLLASQESLVMTSLTTALGDANTEHSPSKDQALAITVLERLKVQRVILDYAIATQSGEFLTAPSDQLPMDLSTIQALQSDPILRRFEQTYDSALHINQIEPNLYLFIRLDTGPIQQELNAYTFRMLSMILLISVVVTLGTMIGVERLVIRPVLYLREDLLTAGTNIQSGIREGQFHASRLSKNDELGEVITTFQHMYAQIWQALDERESASQSEQQERARADQLNQTLTQLHQTQVQLVQAEKMAGLGQLVAGVAHEINNPINFIYGNLTHIQQYVEDLLHLVQLYQHYTPSPAAEIQSETKAVDFEFIQNDLPKLMSSMQAGSERVRNIVLSLRTFSRLDEAELKAVDIHTGIESTLMILNHRLNATETRARFAVIKAYSQVPDVECYPGLLNQVFMNILNNAIDALEERAQQQTPQEQKTEPGNITVRTTTIDEHWVEIAIANNGSSISPEIQQRIFDPFFTTKSVGQGTGMGLSISYQIVTASHQGKLICVSAPEKDTEFVIRIPIQQRK